MQDVRDVLAAVAGDAGFETFEETDEGLNGYVQQALFDQTALDEALEAFPFEEASITYEVAEAEDQDWNAEWEAEGFEPIVVADGQLVVHDGRHLPATSHLLHNQTTMSFLQFLLETYQQFIQINERISFRIKILFH